MVALREEASESRRRDKAASRAEQDIDILYADAGTILGKTINSRVEGVRHHDIGNAQAWYYPEDKVLVLWECFLHDFTPVWSKNSCGFARVVFQESPEPFMTPHRAFTCCVLADRRKEQDIVLALMIALVMIVLHIVRQCMAKRRFPK